MTLAATDTAGFAAAPARDAGVMRLWGWAALAALVMSLPNLLDPMIRFDDFPALWAEPVGYWSKTLEEGRWLNYLWHLRGVETPSWLNFALYQVLWAGFAAGVAWLATGRKGGWYAVVLVLAILVSPPATLISQWFNTLLPGIAIFAAFALLACRLSQRVTRLLMPAFVVATFMSYPTYPLLILAVCLVQTENRGARDLIGLLALFSVSFVAALLAVYGLNYLGHGIFGVAPADWREATGASDLAGLAANLPLLRETLADFAQRTSFEFRPAIWFHLALFIGASVILFRRARWEALYLHAGLWMGMAVVAAQILKMGVVVPPRAFIFAWVIYAILIVRAAEVLSADKGLPGRMARNAVMLVVASYLLQTFLLYASYRDWQADTRAVAALAATSDLPVVIAGDVMQMPSAKAAFIQSPLGMSFRVRQLTGRLPRMCVLVPEACAEANTFRIDLQPEG